MANNRYVNTSFWKDGYIADLDPIEKLVFIYLLTNPQTNLAGVYEINIREIAFDTGIDKDMVVKIMSRFEADNKIIVNNGWVAMLNFQKHQKLNPKTEITVERIFESLPADISSKLAISSTFLASSSKLLLSQRFNGSILQNNSVEQDLDNKLTKPIDSLSHSNRNIIETKSNIDTNVSMAKAGNDSAIKRVPSTDINDMFHQWEIIIGYKIESRIKQNRFACSNLLKKHGREGVIKLITGVAASKTDKYAPNIADFAGLQARYNELISWGHKKKNETGRIATV